MTWLTASAQEERLDYTRPCIRTTQKDKANDWRLMAAQGITTHLRSPSTAPQPILLVQIGLATRRWNSSRTTHTHQTTTSLDSSQLSHISMESITLTAITAPTLLVQSDRDITFAYRRFGKQSDVPIVLHMHFRGNMDFWYVRA